MKTSIFLAALLQFTFSHFAVANTSVQFCTELRAENGYTGEFIGYAKCAVSQSLETDPFNDPVDTDTPLGTWNCEFDNGTSITRDLRPTYFQDATTNPDQTLFYDNASQSSIFGKLLVDGFKFTGVDQYPILAIDLKNGPIAHSSQLVFFSLTADTSQPINESEYFVFINKLYLGNCK